jgi:hypothetical protein
MTFPSSSIFALSVGAGKLTRATQPSPPSAVQRMPPPSVDASSLSRLRASATSSAVSSFSRSAFSLISRSLFPFARHEWHGQVKENRDALARISARELDGLRREIVVACNARSVSLRPTIIKQRNNLPACGHHRDYLGTVPKTVPSCSYVLGFKQVLIVLEYSVEQCKTGRQIE